MTEKTNVAFGLVLTSEDSVSDILAKIRSNSANVTILTANIEDRAGLSSKEIALNIVISFSVSVSANFATKWIEEKVAEIEQHHPELVSHSIGEMTDCEDVPE